MRTNEANILEFDTLEDTSEGPPLNLAPQVGSLVVQDGELRVDYPGNSFGPLPARATVPIQADERRPVLLVFEDGQPGLPIIVGLLDTLPRPGPRPDNSRDLHVDGRRIMIDGDEEIVLRCGEASITLRRNGRVLIRGLLVETRASGVNRIKGGSVQIN